MNAEEKAREIVEAWWRTGGPVEDDLVSHVATAIREAEAAARDAQAEHCLREHLAALKRVRREAEAAAIERCAKVAEAYEAADVISALYIASSIRALATPSSPEEK